MPPWSLGPTGATATPTAAAKGLGRADERQRVRRKFND